MYTLISPSKLLEGDWLTKDIYYKNKLILKKPEYGVTKKDILILKKYKIKTEIIRLADEEIPHGLSARESKDDDWPKIAKKMIESDIIIFSTPIWWGNISNLMQKIIIRRAEFGH